MLRRDFLQTAAGAFFAAALSTSAKTRKKNMNGNIGRHAFVKGMNHPYERHGTDTPLVLLHGGLGAIGEIFGRLLPAPAAATQWSPLNCRATSIRQTLVSAIAAVCGRCR